MTQEPNPPAISTRRTALVAVLLGLAAVMPARGQETPKSKRTKTVLLITADGLRPEEVFGGGDVRLMSKMPGGVEDEAGLRKEFERGTVGERREALMPFFWSVVAKEGQIYGNAANGSVARVSNGLSFSYPGYNEMLTGAADPRINSNAKRPNPNVNVLEWLSGRPGFAGKVGAVGSWDVYPSILNTDRSKIPLNAGWEPLDGEGSDPAIADLNKRMLARKRTWPDCRDDDFTFEVARVVLRNHAPRAFYLGFGDTDEHAHAGRYDLYLRAAHDFDAALKTLWTDLQADPRTRGTTSLVITTDHGRGGFPNGWKSHGATVAWADAIWIAVIGPDTSPLGERSATAPVTQSQVAATVAALLGEDFPAGMPSVKVAPPIADAIR